MSGAGDKHDLLLQAAIRHHVLSLDGAPALVKSAPPKASTDWGLVQTSTVEHNRVQQLRACLSRPIANAVIKDAAAKQRHRHVVTSQNSLVVELRSSGVSADCPSVASRLSATLIPELRYASVSCMGLGH
eukprot:COSAG02_NODE_12804_length_1489_cov_2.582014_1_plen_129_part_10